MIYDKWLEPVRLLQVKQALARQGYGMIDVNQGVGGLGRPHLLQALMQFVCGYHGLDYRDIAHVGHGRMALLHCSEPVRGVWAAKIADGALIGIAATEDHGGSNVQDLCGYLYADGVHDAPKRASGKALLDREATIVPSREDGGAANEVPMGAGELVAMDNGAGKRVEHRRR